MPIFYQLPLLIFLLVLSSSVSPSIAQSQVPGFWHYFCIDTYGNYSKNSTFATNLNTLFSTITSPNTINTAFYNLTAGKNSGDDHANALALCYADISPPDRKSFLTNATREIREVCPTQKEAIGWYDNCMLRYSTRFSILSTMEDYKQLYNDLDDEAPITIAFNKATNSPAPAAPQDNIMAVRTHNARVIAISIDGPSTIIIIAILCILLKMKSAMSTTNFKKNEFDSTLQSLQFKFGTIKQATGEFSHDNMLGRGGYGVVYKGRLPDGQEVAVKRLLKKSRQGDEQFKNEIQTLAKQDHRNLVRLLGFCLEDDEILLIYELVPNRSLDRFIFDSERASMTWNTLYGIIDGIARGLLYLHQDSRLRLIHRDLKAGNVLLDANSIPKIADFGMARLFNIDHTQLVASKIVDTYGYMAPEYALRGYVSMKSDVYSFGVLILEIISGQRINSFINEDTSEGLLSYAWRNWQEGTPWKFVDPALSSDGFSSQSQILQCTHIGLLCVQHNPANRPAMSLVTLMLSSSHSLPVPSPPGFYSPGNVQPNIALLEQTSDQSFNTVATYSENEASTTELNPR